MANLAVLTRGSKSGLLLFLLLASRGCRSDLVLNLFTIASALGFPSLDIDKGSLGEEVTDSVRGLSADAKPVLHAITIDFDLLGSILLQRIELTKVLDHGAIATSPLLHRSNAIEGTIATTITLHANPNHAMPPKTTGSHKPDDVPATEYSRKRWQAKPHRRSSFCSTPHGA